MHQLFSFAQTERQTHGNVEAYPRPTAPPHASPPAERRGGSIASATALAGYRFYIIQKDGDVIGPPKEYELADDTGALLEAKQLVNEAAYVTLLTATWLDAA